MKLKTLRSVAFLMIAASSLSACGEKDTGQVKFWSPFGQSYKTALDGVCKNVANKLKIKIEHKNIAGYPEIRSRMVSAINDESYPNLGIGYPDHLISYIDMEALVPLDSYFSKDEIKDYYKNYMDENYFTDNDGSGEKKLYGIPFNKSTEILAYNGVFVDYCKSVNPSELSVLPKTWQDWETLGPKYMTIYDSLIDAGHLYYDLDGETATNFSTSEKGSRKGDLDFTGVDKAQRFLMGYDSGDNAFITLIKQWGAQYTVVPASEDKKAPSDKKGHVKFLSGDNPGKVIDMFKFFGGLYKKKIFCMPKHVGATYCSVPFQQNKVMFMICSSGGLSHTKIDENLSFNVAPIPYYQGEYGTNKYVIAQGANIFLTDKGNVKSSIKAMKAFTTGEFQADWCLATGYFPSSESATKTKKYQDFLKGVGTETKLRASYRKAANVNVSEYSETANKGWDNFVDPAFLGSAVLREKLTGVLKDAIEKDPSTTLDSVYTGILTAIKNNDDLKLLKQTLIWD